MGINNILLKNLQSILLKLAKGAPMSTNINSIFTTLFKAITSDKISLHYRIAENNSMTTCFHDNFN